MSPLSFPRLTQLTDGRWSAQCRTCGWQSLPQRAKTAADYQRRLHGPEATCKARRS